MSETSEGKMNFLQIKDSKKREEIVNDYIATVRQLQNRNEAEKTLGLQHRAELEKTFSPITEATKQSTDTLKKHLQPIETELKTINKREQATVKKQTWDESDRKGAFEYYSNNVKKENLDKYFSIHQYDGRNVLGDTDIQVDDESNIRVDDTTYKGTPGLWALLMLKAPASNTYTETDLEEYTQLAKQTNLLSNPTGVTSRSRPYQTKKSQILKELVGDNSSWSSRKRQKVGKGVVVYLPGDIKGLLTKLQLLLAEFDSGNKVSTRNEIVPILDELRRRNRISTERYKEINNHIAATL